MDSQKFIEECRKTGEQTDVTEDVVRKLLELWVAFHEGFQGSTLLEPNQCLESLLICTGKIVFSPKYSKKISQNSKSQFKLTVQKCQGFLDAPSQDQNFFDGIASISGNPWMSSEFNDVILKKSIVNATDTAANKLWKTEGWAMLDGRLDYLSRNIKAADRLSQILHVLVMKGHEMHQREPKVELEDNILNPFTIPFPRYLEYLQLYAILACQKTVESQNIELWDGEILLRVIGCLHQKSKNPDFECVFAKFNGWKDAKKAAIFLARTATFKASKSEDMSMLRKFYEKWIQLYEDTMTESEAHVSKTPFAEILEIAGGMPSTNDIYRMADAIFLNCDGEEAREKYMELFIRGITKDLNHIEHVKATQPSETEEIHRLQKTLSSRYLQLAIFFKEFPNTAKECCLTAFSLNIRQSLFCCLFPKSEEAKSISEIDYDPPELVEIREINFETHDTNIEEDLRLPSALCDDLGNVIHNPRYKGFFRWTTDQELEELCRKLIESKTVDAIDNKDLNFVKPDYEKYKDLKPQYDPDDDGTEKGYTLRAYRSLQKKKDILVENLQNKVIKRLKTNQVANRPKVIKRCNKSVGVGPSTGNLSGQELPNTCLKYNPWYSGNCDRKASLPTAHSNVFSQLLQPFEPPSKELSGRNVNVEMENRFYVKLDVLSSFIPAPMNSGLLDKPCGNFTGQSQSCSKNVEESITAQPQPCSEEAPVSGESNGSTYPQWNIPDSSTLELWPSMDMGDGFPADEATANSFRIAVHDRFAKASIVGGNTSIPRRRRPASFQNAPVPPQKKIKISTREPSKKGTQQMVDNPVKKPKGRPRKWDRTVKDNDVTQNNQRQLYPLQSELEVKESDDLTNLEDSQSIIDEPGCSSIKSEPQSDEVQASVTDPILPPESEVIECGFQIIINRTKPKQESNACTNEQNLVAVPAKPVKKRKSTDMPNREQLHISSATVNEISVDRTPRSTYLGTPIPENPEIQALPTISVKSTSDNPLESTSIPSIFIEKCFPGRPVTKTYSKAKGKRKLVVVQSQWNWGMASQESYTESSTPATTSQCSDNIPLGPAAVSSDEQPANLSGDTGSTIADSFEKQCSLPISLNCNEISSASPSANQSENDAVLNVSDAPTKVDQLISPAVTETHSLMSRSRTENQTCTNIETETLLKSNDTNDCESPAETNAKEVQGLRPNFPSNTDIVSEMTEEIPQFKYATFEENQPSACPTTAITTNSLNNSAGLESPVDNNVIKSTKAEELRSSLLPNQNLSVKVMPEEVSSVPAEESPNLNNSTRKTMIKNDKLEESRKLIEEKTGYEILPVPNSPEAVYINSVAEKNENFEDLKDDILCLNEESSSSCNSSLSNIKDNSPAPSQASDSCSSASLTSEIGRSTSAKSEPRVISFPLYQMLLGSGNPLFSKKDMKSKPKPNIHTNSIKDENDSRNNKSSDANAVPALLEPGSDANMAKSKSGQSNTVSLGEDSPTTIHEQTVESSADLKAFGEKAPDTPAECVQTQQLHTIPETNNTEPEQDSQAQLETIINDAIFEPAAIQIYDKSDDFLNHSVDAVEGITLASDPINININCGEVIPTATKDLMITRALIEANPDVEYEIECAVREVLDNVIDTIVETNDKLHKLLENIENVLTKDGVTNGQESLTNTDEFELPTVVENEVEDTENKNAVEEYDDETMMDNGNNVPSPLYDSSNVSPVPSKQTTSDPICDDSLPVQDYLDTTEPHQDSAISDFFNEEATEALGSKHLEYIDENSRNELSESVTNETCENGQLEESISSPEFIHGQVNSEDEDEADTEPVRMVGSEDQEQPETAIVSSNSNCRDYLEQLKTTTEGEGAEEILSHSLEPTIKEKAGEPINKSSVNSVELATVETTPDLREINAGAESGNSNSSQKKSLENIDSKKDIEVICLESDESDNEELQLPMHSNTTKNSVKEKDFDKSSVSSKGSRNKTPRPVTPVETLENILQTIERRRRAKLNQPLHKYQEVVIKVAASVVKHVEKYGGGLTRISACHIPLKRLSDHELPVNARGTLKPLKRSSRIKHRHQVILVDSVNPTVLQNSNSNEDDDEGQESSRSSSPEIEVIEVIPFQLGQKKNAGPGQRVHCTPRSNNGLTIHAAIKDSGGAVQRTVATKRSGGPILCNREKKILISAPSETTALKPGFTKVTNTGSQCPTDKNCSESTPRSHVTATKMETPKRIQRILRSPTPKLPKNRKNSSEDPDFDPNGIDSGDSSTDSSNSDEGKLTHCPHQDFTPAVVFGIASPEEVTVDEDDIDPLACDGFSSDYTSQVNISNSICGIVPDAKIIEDSASSDEYSDKDGEILPNDVIQPVPDSFLITLMGSENPVNSNTDDACEEVPVEDEDQITEAIISFEGQIVVNADNVRQSTNLELEHHPNPMQSCTIPGKNEEESEQSSIFLDKNEESEQSCIFLDKNEESEQSYIFLDKNEEETEQNYIIPEINNESEFQRLSSDSSAPPISLNNISLDVGDTVNEGQDQDSQSPPQPSVTADYDDSISTDDLNNFVVLLDNDSQDDINKSAAVSPVAGTESKEKSLPEFNPNVAGGVDNSIHQPPSPKTVDSDSDNEDAPGSTVSPLPVTESQEDLQDLPNVDGDMDKSTSIPPSPSQEKMDSDSDNEDAPEVPVSSLPVSESQEDLQDPFPTVVGDSASDNEDAPEAAVSPLPVTESQEDLQGLIPTMDGDMDKNISMHSGERMDSDSEYVDALETVDSSEDQREPTPSPEPPILHPANLDYQTEFNSDDDAPSLESYDNV